MTMKNFIFSIIIIIICNNCYSQIIYSASRAEVPDEYLYNTVMKNILFKMSQDLTRNYADGFIVNSLSWRGFPDRGSYLVLEFTLTEYKIPNKKMDIYQVGFQNKHKSFFDDYTIYRPIYSYRKYLVGFDRQSFEVIFISGNLFLHPIAKYFDLDIRNPESFYYFLELKTALTRFKYLRKSWKYLYFEAYTESAPERVIIKVNRKNYDKIVVIYEKQEPHHGRP